MVASPGAPGLEGLLGPGQGVVKAEGGGLLFGEQGGGEVAFAAVRGDGHDEAARQLPGFADGHGHRGPGAHAQEQAFLAGHPPGRLIGFLVLDVNNLVRPGLIENPRFIRLLHIFQTLDGVAQEGLHSHHLDVGIEPLHALIEAHEGAGGAHGGHHHGDLAFGLLPDLPAGGLMGLGIDGVVELVRQKILVRMFPGHLVDLFDGAVGPQVGRGQEEFGAHALEDAFALQAGGLGHGQEQAIALDGAHHGQTDAGIAAGGFDDGLLRGQLACGLRRLDHGQGRAVLDGTAGIEIFQLDVNLHLRMGIEAVQADNGGLPDELQYVIGLAQHSGIRTPGVGGDAPY